MARAWIVGRTHRAHAIPMVGAFVIWLSIWSFGNFDFPFVRMLVVDSLDQRRLSGEMVDNSSGLSAASRVCYCRR